MRLSIIGHVGSNPTFSASQRPINGGVAQLGERVIRIYEVRGSNPLISTIFDQIKQAFKLASDCRQSLEGNALGFFYRNHFSPVAIQPW